MHAHASHKATLVQLQNLKGCRDMHCLTKCTQHPEDPHASVVTPMNLLQAAKSGGSCSTVSYVNEFLYRLALSGTVCRQATEVFRSRSSIQRGNSAFRGVRS